MPSAYDDVIAALEAYSFSIPNVVVKEPYDESSKSYPALVVHEPVNVPVNHGTVNGETRTALAYQVDILTQNCVDNGGNVLGRAKAGRVLYAEVSDCLNALKITRRSKHTDEPASDVLRTVWRGDCVLDSHDYLYRQ